MTTIPASHTPASYPAGIPVLNSADCACGGLVLRCPACRLPYCAECTPEPWQRCRPGWTPPPVSLPEAIKILAELDRSLARLSHAS